MLAEGRQDIEVRSRKEQNLTAVHRFMAGSRGDGAIGACRGEAGYGAGKVDIRLPGTGDSNSPGTRPFYYNHLDDPVDSDQEVVNKDLSLSGYGAQSSL